MSIVTAKTSKKKQLKPIWQATDQYINLLLNSMLQKSSVSKWANEYREECLYTTNTTSESNDAKEIRRLNQLLNEKDKEIAFLKKQRRSLRRKSISGISIH